MFKSKDQNRNLASQPDPSLHRVHGTDAPDIEDIADSDALRAHMQSLMSQRVSRRSLFGGALGAAAGGAAVASPLGMGAATAASPPRTSGDADTINDALDENYLHHVTKTVVGFGDTSSGWRPGGSPANLDASGWIAREMRHVGLKKVAQLPVPIDRWVFNGASVSVDGGPTVEASSWGGVPGTPDRVAFMPKSSTSASGTNPTSTPSTLRERSS